MFRYSRSNFLLPVIATFFLWMKTYVVYKTSFHFKIENKLQEFILFINPISFLLIIFGFSLYFKTDKIRTHYIWVTSFLLSFILYANVVFYRFFNDFITMPILFQTSNFGELGDSATSEMHWWDFVYFLDLLIIFLIIKIKRYKTNFVPMYKVYRRNYFLISVGIFIFNLGLSEAERPQLLTRTFDRELLVKNLGAYDYQLYDILLQSKSTAQKAFADGTKLVDIENYVHANDASPNKRFFGIAKGRNLIIISLESTQNFVIHSKVNGQEITPYLNQFVNNSYYFNRFYHQTGQGKTSDAEFLVENSLYPLNRGAVFFTHGSNAYQSLAKKLNDIGYFTAAMHANNKSFWNRDIMYKAIGYQQFFSSTSYNITEDNSVGWGLKDIPFFEQSVGLMKDLPKPFYVKMITLTNHHPFRLDNEDKLISDFTSKDSTVNRYFTTVRYEDEAIKRFIQKLKDEGLYNQSIIVMYGDHHGISENHNEAMSQYFGKEILPFESVDLQKVPFIIHIPGITDQHRGKLISKVGGQIDVRPTILHLLGINTKNDIQFGEDLFSPNYDHDVIFRDGRFATNQYLWTRNACYSQNTRQPIDKQYCEPFFEKESKELNYSDRVIYGDLLRFYNQR
jgi:lipoteichoic acid synthase